MPSLSSWHVRHTRYFLPITTRSATLSKRSAKMNSPKATSSPSDGERGSAAAPLTMVLCFSCCARRHPHRGPRLLLGTTHPSAHRAPQQGQQRLCPDGAGGKRILFHQEAHGLFLYVFNKESAYAARRVTACQYQ